MKQVTFISVPSPLLLFRWIVAGFYENQLLAVDTRPSLSQHRLANFASHNKQ